MNVAEALPERASERPDAPALMTPQATVSYGELDRAVAHEAKRLAESGLARGDIVGIDAKNQITHLMAVLALARLGACQFSFQPTDTAAQKQALAARIGMTARLASADDGLLDARYVPAPAFERGSDLKDVPDASFVGGQKAGDPCMIVRTSGTTGVPKLAAVTFAQSWARTELTPADTPDTRQTTASHLAFISTRENLFRCMASGGAFTLFEGRRSEEMVEFLRHFRITYFTGTPHHARLLLDRAPEEGCLLPDMQFFRLGTAPASEKLRNDIRARITPNLAISYGATETGMATLLTPSRPETGIPGAVGCPIGGVEIEIIDDTGRQCSSGEIGLLRLRSPRVVSGYLDDPAATASAFRNGWYLTGDRAEMTPRGTLVIHGRDDDMMIFDGINIFPAEIENALLNHPAVVEAAAFSLPSDDRGDRPWAAVVLKSSTPRKELLDHAASRFTAARLNGLISVPDLPRNAAGKIDTAKLREMAEASRGKGK